MGVVADGDPPKKMSRQSSAASSIGVSVGASNASTVTKDIRAFAVRCGLTPTEIPKFHRLVFNLVVDTRNPFTFPMEPTVRELVDFLRPGSSDFLPSRHVVSGRLLQEAAREAQNTQTIISSSICETKATWNVLRLMDGKTRQRSTLKVWWSCLDRSPT